MKNMIQFLMLVMMCLLPLSAKADNEPRIYVEKDSISVGTLGPNVRKVFLEVPIRNTGNSPLTIYKIKTDCICTRTKFERTPVAPGEKKIINVDIEIEPFFTGENTKSIMIYSNAIEQQKQIFFTFTIE